MSVGQGYAMGTGTPPGFQAQQIVYYVLSFTTDSSGLNYTYLSTSGIVTGTFNINTFVQSVAAGDPQVSSALPSGEVAPDITVTCPCYVVVQLDPSKNWRFLPGVAPMMMENNPGTKYCALNLVDANGTVYAGQAPTSPACLILYFSVTSVAAASQGVEDAFSYYLQFVQSSGGTINVIVDPDIKNDGGPPH